ncbi:MAG: TonB-dependent receptor [Proteobacteria bacterium]|nr:TonB-dependent receptor [Pseudomonadota bacterium]MDA0914579.1 TonB-dependent receptor [Pseudomonadota bacterium]MDA1033562.1 TonB-dependent receptor [Pseudomonadota bacterium]
MNIKLITHTSRLAIAGATAFAVLAVPSIASAQDSEDGAQQRVEDDLHDRRVDSDGVIIVSAEGLKQLDVLAGTSVIEIEEIQRNLNGQLGEVLAKLPGVSATSFSPGASRPVLRGFQGERVRILVDGLGTADVSNTSADHATTIEPLTAERIEVLRGPAVLLFGNQAIGGAVNVIDKRIPRRVPSESFHLDALIAADTASDLRNAAGSLDIPLSPNFVVHVDGSYRNSDDLEIGGFQVAPELRAELLEEAEEEEAEGEFEEAEELREAAEQRGVIPNTATETYTINAGASIFSGDSVFGASIGYYNTDYGVPGRPGAGHHHGEEGEEGEEEGEEIVTIGLEQWRADALADIALGDGFFEKLKVRLGYSDYTHTEFEGDEVGTVFDVESFEARVELAQSDTGPSTGAFGAQYTYRDFAAIGEEAFVAPNTTNQFALFGLQEFGPGPFQLETGVRLEFTEVESEPLGVSRSFTNFSGALGFVYETDDALRAGVNFSRVERAPSAEELFAAGPHIATQQFEIGDPNLRSEAAWGLEGFVRGQVGDANLSLAVYRQWFDNYIYLSANGEEEDELPVFLILQQDADYFGIEGELSFPLYRTGSSSVIADLRASYIDAELGDGTAVPRIPPVELLGALEYQSDAFDVRGEVQWFGQQDDVDAFETPTDSFTLVNFSVAWRPMPDFENVTLVLNADNVFDVIGRRQASFTKDFVPLAGRNFKASVRFSF